MLKRTIVAVLVLGLAGGCISSSASSDCPAAMPSLCQKANGAETDLVCVDTNTNDQNCGSCGNVCGTVDAGPPNLIGWQLKCVNGTCVTPKCVPTTCSTAAPTPFCGTIQDGCGGPEIDCGGCPEHFVCVPSQMAPVIFPGVPNICIAQCTETGKACTNGADCCSSACDASVGQCQCGGTGAPCTLSSDCCSGHYCTNTNGTSVCT